MRDIEPKLFLSRPEKSPANERFIQATMLAAKQAKARETFSSATRTKSVNKQKEHFMAKLLTIPKAAFAAFAVAIVSSGAVYAALNWFGTNTTSTQRKDGVYLTTVDCSPSTVQALKHDDRQTNTTEYKILKPKLITAKDFEQDELAACEQRAIESTVRKQWPRIYETGDAHDGLYYPMGRYGTVKSVADNQVTIASIPVDQSRSPRKLVTTTLAIDQKTLVTDRGRATSASVFKPGDPVYFIFQNKVGTERQTPTVHSTIRALAKTQYDHGAIKEKMLHAADQKAFVIIKKSDAYGG